MFSLSKRALHLLLETLLLLLLSTSSFAGFKVQQVIPTAEYPYSVAIADLNQDGIPDLVLAEEIPLNTINIYWGVGDGTFIAGPAYTAPFGLQTVITADLNLDGKPDVLAVSGNFYPGIGNMIVLLNNGDGTLAAPVGYRVGQEPHDIAIGDMNEDGIPDVVVAFGAYAGRAGVSVLLGKGDGAFLSRRTYGARRWPQNLALGDFNRDGHLDVIAASVSRDLVVRLGNGDGTLGPPHKIIVNRETSRYIGRMAVADFSGDGIPDVAVPIGVNGGATGYVIMTAVGDGTFTLTDHQLPPLVFAQAFSTADFNHDGVPDLVMADSRGTTILLNTGNATFENGGSWGLSGASGATTADLNGDGLIDLVQTSFPYKFIAILLNTGP